jgi:hypothetical protein
MAVHRKGGGGPPGTHNISHFWVSIKKLSNLITGIIISITTTKPSNRHAKRIGNKMQ